MIEESEIKVNQNFSRQNMVSCMMPPLGLEFYSGDLDKYTSEYSERCMTLVLNKQTLPKLIASESSYVVVDFFDFCQPVTAMDNTTFSTYDYTFYNANSFKENKDRISIVDFFKLPNFLWYGYMDMYFKSLKEKFGKNIILNRLNCSLNYITKQGKIVRIPENLNNFGSARYNVKSRELEDYIIDIVHMLWI